MSLILYPTFLNAGTKRPIRIAVIDSGYTYTEYSKVKFCATGHKDFTNTGIRDNHGHGTHITNTIVTRLTVDYCIIIIKFHDPKTNKYFSEYSSQKQFDYLLSQDVDVINYSAGGPGYFKDEKKSIVTLLKRGVKIFVAAGNEGLNLNEDCNYYPACYNLKGLRVVGSINKDNKRSKFSNYGKVVDSWEIGVDVVEDTGYNGPRAMNGTSQATAIATANYVNRRFK